MLIIFSGILVAKATEINNMKKNIVENYDYIYDKKKDITSPPKTAHYANEYTLVSTLA
jgi:hypothetical protein